MPRPFHVYAIWLKVIEGIITEILPLAEEVRRASSL